MCPRLRQPHLLSIFSVLGLFEEHERSPSESDAVLAKDKVASSDEAIAARHPSATRGFGDGVIGWVAEQKSVPAPHPVDVNSPIDQVLQNKDGVFRTSRDGIGHPWTC